MRPRTRLVSAAVALGLLACAASARRPSPAAVVADAGSPPMEAAASPTATPLSYAEAVRRFPEIASFPRPQELSEVPWLEKVDAVRLWVDSSELWPGAPRRCTEYAFHRDRTPAGRDGADWVAPRPRAVDPDAQLRLRTYLRLEVAGDVEVIGGALVVHPDRLAYVGVNAHLAARCEWESAIERPDCRPRRCEPCTHIRFHDVSDDTHRRWSAPPQAYRLVTVADPSCAPCDPGPRAGELALARATAEAIRVLRPDAGPVLFRTLAGCAAHVRAAPPPEP